MKTMLSLKTQLILNNDAEYVNKFIEYGLITTVYGFANLFMYVYLHVLKGKYIPFRENVFKGTNEKRVYPDYWRIATNILLELKTTIHGTEIIYNEKDRIYRLINAGYIVRYLILNPCYIAHDIPILYECSIVDDKLELLPLCRYDIINDLELLLL